MVKYKSLLDNYRCSLLDGMDNSFSVHSVRTEKMSKEHNIPEVTKIKEDQYIPSWRAPCDAWVSKKVEDRTGVHTPVYLLYNAYIKDNPDDYMDIGQFGKVLRSRFPYRKRRRGKQGQQVYVYQDVALKTAEETAEDYAQPDCDTPTSSPRQTPPNSSSQGTTMMSVAGLSIVVRNDTGGRLLSSPQLHKEREASVSPKSSRNTSSPDKRKDSADINEEQSSLTFKRQKRGPDDDESDDTTGQQSEHDPTRSGDEKFANASLCRMAIGRRWIDANLVDMLGHHTYANDILQSYSVDHPNEPITFTSLSLLIRGKFPGKRKKVTIGSETKFIYQDLKLKRSQTIEASVMPSFQESKSPEAPPPLSRTGAINETRGQIPPSPNAFVAVPVNRRITTSNLVSSNRYVPYMPVVLSYQTKNNLHGPQFGPVMFPTVIPSTSYVTAKGSNSLTPKPTVLNCIPPLEDILVENRENRVSDEQNHFNEKTSSDIGKRVTKSPQANRIERTVPVQNYHRMKRLNLQPRPVSTNKVDMNVSEYIASELLEMNDLDKITNCTLSIKVPTVNEVSTLQNISSSRNTSPRPEMGESVMESTWEVTPNYGNIKCSEVEYHAMNLSSTSSSVHQIPSFVNSEIPLVVENMPEIPLVVENMPEIPLGVGNMPIEESFKPKKTWDYEMRKRLSPEPARSLDHEMRKSISPEPALEEKDPVYTHKKMKRHRFRGIEASGSATEYQNGNHENRSDNPTQVTDKFMYASMHKLSLENKGSGGSPPTSTSPPGAAMSRLAEEIDTSSPQVGEPSSQTSARASSSSTSEAPSSTKNTVNRYGPQFIEIIKSIMSTARETLGNPGIHLDGNLLERSLERAVLKDNPAVSYESQNSDHLSCSVTSSLKDLELSNPEQIKDLLLHHQSCSGFGCSKECQMLRAAYIHIALFRHKCSVWNSFYKIIAKHSKRCRHVSCGVEFCHFVKHELHLNGTSVLPMQLLKERLSLEAEFEECEGLGAHDGDLHCRHRPRSKLPVTSNASRRQHHIDNQQLNARTTATNKISSQDQDILALTISSRFPDTPMGNALAVQVTKTVDLVRELFKKPPDAR